MADSDHEIRETQEEKGFQEAARFWFIIWLMVILGFLVVIVS